MKRVEHALAVVTTTHPVAVCHVKNNMAPALLPSHSPIAVHELHRRLREHRLPERRTPFAALMSGTRRLAKENLNGLQAGIPQA